MYQKLEPCDWYFSRTHCYVDLRVPIVPETFSCAGKFSSRISVHWKSGSENGKSHWECKCLIKSKSEGWKVENLSKQLVTIKSFSNHHLLMINISLVSPHGHLQGCFIMIMIMVVAEKLSLIDRRTSVEWSISLPSFPPPLPTPATSSTSKTNTIIMIIKLIIKTIKIIIIIITMIIKLMICRVGCVACTATIMIIIIIIVIIKIIIMTIKIC